MPINVKMDYVMEKITPLVSSVLFGKVINTRIVQALVKHISGTVVIKTHFALGRGGGNENGM